MKSETLIEPIQNKYKGSIEKWRQSHQNRKVHDLVKRRISN